MYFVGDEFAFDFVPADAETPVFTNEDEVEYSDGIAQHKSDPELKLTFKEIALASNGTGGPIVGSAEGAIDGSIEGTDVGLSVGSGDGLNDGAPDTRFS